MVRFLFADAAAFLMFFRAVALCFAEAMFQFSRVQSFLVVWMPILVRLSKGTVVIRGNLLRIIDPLRAHLHQSPDGRGSRAFLKISAD